VRSQQSCLPSN